MTKADSKQATPDPSGLPRVLGQSQLTASIQHFIETRPIFTEKMRDEISASLGSQSEPTTMAIASVAS